MDSQDFLEDMKKEAKIAFKKYSNSHPNKITYEEFEHFVKDYFTNETDKEDLAKIDIKQLFTEFKSSSSDALNEKEFEEAWKDLTISRMKTKESF